MLMACGNNKNVASNEWSEQFGQVGPHQATRYSEYRDQSGFSNLTLCMNPSAKLGILSVMGRNLTMAIFFLILAKLLPVVQPFAGMYCKNKANLLELVHSIRNECTVIFFPGHGRVGSSLTMNPFSKTLGQINEGSKRE